MTESTPGVKEWILEQARAARDVRARDEPALTGVRAGETGSQESRLPGDILNYEPFPKQCQFHASPAKYRLFGGAAGPGKSKALLMEAVVQALHHPNVNTLLLRRTFPELEASLLHYFRRDVPRSLYVAFHESKHLVEWTNGSTTRFGYCASEHDVYQYQGAEYLFIGIDELTLFTLRQWQFLTSRNRCAVPGTFPCMAGATNPGNIGHAWVKALWIDKQAAPGMERPEEYNPQDYDFIPARFFDNPIYAADKNYQKTLLALPTNLKRAFFDGDWEVFAGQYFDRFDLGRNTARAEEVEWQPWWPRWISIDWGFEHPAATYWHAQAPGTFATGGARRGKPKSLKRGSGFAAAAAAASRASSACQSMDEVMVLFSGGAGFCSGTAVGCGGALRCAGREALRFWICVSSGARLRGGGGGSQSSSRLCATSGTTSTRILLSNSQQTPACSARTAPPITY